MYVDRFLVNLIACIVIHLSPSCAKEGQSKILDGLIRRQAYGGMDGYMGPFQAYWQEGLVPGQGLPQIGMSAYGYSLPGLGLTGFLSPDAAILAEAGEGNISENDLDHLDDNMYGIGGIHNGGNNDNRVPARGPDPDYPGHFKGEDDNDNDYKDDDDYYRHHHHYHYHDSGESLKPLSVLPVVCVLHAALAFLEV